MTNHAEDTSTKRRRKVVKIFSLTAGLLCILFVLFVFWLFYSSGISSKEYADIERRMRAVYQGMRITDVDTSKYCYHYQDGKGDSKILKCTVSMAGYADAKDEETLSAIADQFAQHLRPLSKSAEIWDREGGPYAYEKPFRSGMLSVKDSDMNMGCAVYVKTGADANDLDYGLPVRDTAGKAVLALSCGGASRGSYFEMRQF